MKIIYSERTKKKKKREKNKQQINIKRLKTYEEKEIENYRREAKKTTTINMTKMKWIDTDKHSMPAF